MRHNRCVLSAAAFGLALAAQSSQGHAQAGSDGEAMAMGDLVLTEGEVPAVIAELQTGGIEQTALHNYLQRESPPGAVPASPNAPPFPLDTATLAQALGRGGSVDGGVYQVSMPRAESIRMEGMEIPPAMGAVIFPRGP